MSFSSFKNLAYQVSIQKKLLTKIILPNEFFQNETFESPLIDIGNIGYKHYENLTPVEKEQYKWFSGGNSGKGAAISNGEEGFNFPDFINGQQALAMQRDSFIQQDIYLNIGTYTFSTYFISRNGTEYNPIEVSINDEIITTINEVVTEWTLFTHTFNILQEGNKTLRLEATIEEGNKTTGIDLVALSRKRIAYTPVSNPFTSANLTINNSIEPSKNGDYIASHSSDQNYGNFYNAFNGITTDTAFISDNNHNQSTGIHNGDFSTTTEDGTSYVGEWLQIKLPSSILLKRYEIMGRFGSPRADKKEFYLLGSNDDDNVWYLIDSQNISSRDYWTPYFDNKLPSYFNVSPENSYSYYRVVINSTFPYNAGGTYSGYAGVAQLNLYSNASSFYYIPIQNDTMVSDTTTQQGATGYEASSSGVSHPNYDAFHSFNGEINNYWHSKHTYNNGEYTGDVTTQVGESESMAGEWLQIKIPSAIILKSFAIQGRQGGYSNRHPKIFTLVGSNGIDSNGDFIWVEITSISLTENPNYDLSSYSTLSNTNSYSYYRLIFQTNFDGLAVNLAHFHIYGYEEGN